MRSIFSSATLLLCFCGLTAQARTEAIPPAIDKAKLEAYIRYAEGFSPGVKFSIDDPAPSPFSGYYRLLVHLSTTDTKTDRVYYLTADGKQVMTGSIWNLNQSPFLDTLNRVSTKGPSFGPADARIKLVVFSDFECPYCREFARTVRENISQKYPKDVRVIFKDFPIDSIHPWASAAAEAAHCVENEKPEAFWTFHDWIFQHQGEISKNNLREKTLAFAKDQNLDSTRLASCIDKGETRTEVEDNLKEGRALQIQQTPTFFLDGRTVPGAVSWSTLNLLIQMEINRPAFVTGPAGNSPLPAHPDSTR